MADDGKHRREALKRHSLRLMVAAMAVGLAVAPPADCEEGEGGRPWISGSFDTGIDFRASDGDTDIDLDQSLRLRLDPEKHERIHIRGSLWMSESLDGDEDKNSILRGIDDASGSDVRARLLYLYVDVDDIFGDSVLRIGRQRILQGIAYNRIDGVSYKQRHQKWDWYAFGGARATVYGDAHDDLAVGAGAAYRHSYRTRLALDLYYGEEDNRGSDDVFRRRPVREALGYAFSRQVEDDLDDTEIGLTLMHALTDNVRTYGRYIWKDGEGDEITLSLTGYVPQWELTGELAYRGQLNDAGDKVRDVTSFYRILGDYEAYNNVLLSLHRPLTERVVLSVEAELNNADNDDPLTANRDYERYAAILSMEDLAPGVDASLSLEHWDVDDSESSWAVTGEVSKEWERVEASIGVNFERFEDRLVQYNPRPIALEHLRIILLPTVFLSFNPLVSLFDTSYVDTKENVYTVYGKTRWSIRENQDLTTRVTFSEDDGPEDPYWRVQAGYTIRF